MRVTKAILLKYMQQNTYRPMTLEELSLELEMKGKLRGYLLDMLLELKAAGEIVSLKGERYGLSEEMNLVPGVLQGHKDGYCFLVPDDPKKPHIFVSRIHRNGAFTDDRVVVRIQHQWGGHGKPEGAVIRILERGHKTLVGTFELKGGVGLVVPDNYKFGSNIIIAKEGFNDASHLDKVVAEVTEWPSNDGNPVGKVIEILGKKNDPGVDLQSILREYNLTPEFPPAVIKEVAGIPLSVQPGEKTGRRDFTGQVVITIDGEDAKDFDDAIAVESLSNGNFRLFVHIADVSHYVREGRPLDAEAYSRGTSVYLPGQVVPMLPEALSNNLCSLVAGQDRLTQSAIMDIDHRGNVVSYELADSVIRVKERMTYEKVQAILDGDPAMTSCYQSLVPSLKMMQSLAHILYKKRIDEGALDFDLPETKVILDKAGKPAAIIAVKRLFSHRLIEDFMLAANKTVAKHMAKKGSPFLYRIHEKPDDIKLKTFSDYVKVLGLKLVKTEGASQKHLQSILAAVKGRLEEGMVNMLLLRSMKLAVYSNVNAGHFGLAFDHYTHFTSPIRRYPDLMVHRLLKKNRKEGELSVDQKVSLEKHLAEVAGMSSQRERNAQEAEMECLKLKKIEFMKDKLGEDFKAVITGVQSYGFFVEIKEWLVEGLVHVSSLDNDYYVYSEQDHTLKGKRSGKVFRLADPVEVKLTKVDAEKRQMDFVLQGGFRSDKKKGKFKKEKHFKKNRKGKGWARR